jgi:hypothetical protein
MKVQEELRREETYRKKPRCGPDELWTKSRAEQRPRRKRWIAVGIDEASCQSCGETAVHATRIIAEMQTQTTRGYTPHGPAAGTVACEPCAPAAVLEIAM